MWVTKFSVHYPILTVFFSTPPRTPIFLCFCALVLQAHIFAHFCLGIATSPRPRKRPEKQPKKSANQHGADWPVYAIFSVFSEGCEHPACGSNFRGLKIQAQKQSEESVPKARTSGGARQRHRVPPSLLDPQANDPLRWMWQHQSKTLRIHTPHVLRFRSTRISFAKTTQKVFLSVFPQLSAHDKHSAHSQIRSPTGPSEWVTSIIKWHAAACRAPSHLRLQMSTVNC